MGWNTGSELMSTIIDALVLNVSDPLIRQKIYLPIILEFLDHDWDTEDENRGDDEAFDKALDEALGE